MNRSIIQDNKKSGLAVLMITRNEAYHIGKAIDNIKDIATEIIVVDSGSSDETVQIAKSKGAKAAENLESNFFIFGFFLFFAYFLGINPR